MKRASLIHQLLLAMLVLYLNSTGAFTPTYARALHFNTYVFSRHA